MSEAGGIHLVADEITALGFRLAGVTVHTPAPEDVTATLERARSRATVVLITAELAARLPSHVLESALAATSGSTLVIPDVGQTHPVPDHAARWRRLLGVEP